MKKIHSFLLIASLLIGAKASAQTEATPQQAQQTPDTPAYIKNPELPAFNILMLDSSKVLNTYNIPSGKPIVIMNFMPDCEHCQKLTEILLKGMDSMKHIRFYLVSPMTLTDIKGFYNKFHLERYRNITIGKDYEFFGPTYYKIRFVPFLILYDKNKKFVRTFEGSATVKDIVEAAEGKKQ